MSSSSPQHIPGLDISLADLLQTLIRFDTSNPPGNERECITLIQSLLDRSGFDTEILARSPERPNLITRLPGTGGAPPLLLYGHVDVVPAAGQDWRYPPFDGQIADGCVWGRGALDMKGGIVMMLAALMKAKNEDAQLPGDVILALVSDEEAGGEYGARYLVEQHPQHFEGVRYALGEFGGFSFPLGGKRFYPVMVAEKQVCHLKLTVRGTAGHGSLSTKDGAMGRLAEILDRLEHRPLPVHVTPVARDMFQTIAERVPWITGLALRRLLNPSTAGLTLKLMGERAAVFGPLLRNTVNATVVRGGQTVNVAPGVIEILLDGRLLPGFGPADLMTELKAIIGAEAEMEVIHHDPGPPQTDSERPDMGLFKLLSQVVEEADPQGIPVPMLLPASTDARFFSRLGIQTYGFLPMNLHGNLPAAPRFLSAVHGVDECLPVECLSFGADAIYQVLSRFGRD